MAFKECEHKTKTLVVVDVFDIYETTQEICVDCGKKLTEPNEYINETTSNT